MNLILATEEMVALDTQENSNNSIELSDKELPDEIFRAYDIRGIAVSTEKQPATLTPEIAELVGKAIGSLAKKQGESEAVTGRDGRTSGLELQQALNRGLQSTGLNVTDVGAVPTPVLYYAGSSRGAGASVMVTGSHNPPEYNGLKMTVAGSALSGEEIQKLKHQIKQSDFHVDNSNSSQYQQIDIREDYIKRIAGDITLSKTMRIAVDCGNGIAGNTAPDLLKTMGCEIEELYCDVDGSFPNHHPDPSKPENLAELQECVVKNSFDIGLAFDGDGDRLGVIDSSGKIIWPDRHMMLYAKDILERNAGQGEIIYDVKCSRKLADVIEECGGKATMWKTGHSFMKAKLKETGALLAGEMSGHIFFKERWYGFDDALYTAARLLEILSKETLSSSEVFSQLPDSVNTPELNVKFTNEQQLFEFTDKFSQEAEFPEAKLTKIDGLRVDFNQGWGLVRPSNTTPILVMRFEADSEQDLLDIQAKFKTQILKINPNITLPF